MKRDDFEELVSSVRQAGKIRRKKMKPSRVFRYRAADIKKIREKLGKSQPEFALMIGVSVATLRNWEQGRRKPDGPARALLKIAAKNPDAVVEALSA
jgi:putative transcriptional regulator